MVEPDAVVGRSVVLALIDFQCSFMVALIFL